MERVEAFTTISEGTHNAVDIAAALLPIARELLSQATINDLESVVEAGADDDDAQSSIGEALEELDEYAAPACYIGFHPHDGASLGCWPSVDMAEEIAEARVDDLGELARDFCGLAVQISDHGNVTLYECHAATEGDSPECVEVWGVV
jgi:hypothetical protein